MRQTQENRLQLRGASHHPQVGPPQDTRQRTYGPTALRGPSCAPRPPDIMPDERASNPRGGCRRKLRCGRKGDRKSDQYRSEFAASRSKHSKFHVPTHVLPAVWVRESWWSCPHANHSRSLISCVKMSLRDAARSGALDSSSPPFSTDCKLPLHHLVRLAPGWRLLPGRDEAGPVSEDDGLHAVAEAELAEDASDVGFDRPL